MAIGTAIMIVCLVLLVVVGFFFKSGQSSSTKETDCVANDQNLKGLDGCGIIGYSIDDLNKELYDDK